MKKIGLTSSLLVCSAIGTVQATSLSYNGDGSVVGYSLDGISPAGQPNFENDASFTWDSTVKISKSTGEARNGKASILVTYVDGIFLFNDPGSSYTVDNGGFTLEASLKYSKQTGMWEFQRGSLDITGAVTTAEGSASGGLLNVRLTDWAYTDSLIGFNTVINGQASTICDIYNCTSNESVYVSLADGLFNPLDNDAEGVYSYASDGLAVTTIPVPAAVWLFGSGLIGLVGLARRKRV